MASTSRARGGSSTEFSDYRDYSEGDDIRYVDWNIFSRLGRPYLKLFHHEEEMHIVLLIDASSSMTFDGKLDQAKRLAAAFGVMGLFNQERVSVASFRSEDDPPRKLRPTTGRGAMPKLFAALDAIESGGSVSLEKGVELLLREHRGRGVCVVLSDFLTYGDPAAALTRLVSAGLEPFALQVLAPVELDPDLAGDLRFVDSEGAGTLDVTAGSDVVSLYHDYRQRFQHRLHKAATQRGGRFAFVSSDTPLKAILFDQLQRAGWIR